MAQKPKRQPVVSASGLPSGCLAMSPLVSIPQEQQATFHTRLQSEPPHVTFSAGSDWTLKELACARMLNFDLPEDPALAVDRLEHAIQRIMGVSRCAILAFHEDTGMYESLNELKVPGCQPRKITLQEIGPREIREDSDRFFRNLPGYGGETIHTCVMLETHLEGQVIVADKTDGTPFNAQDQMLLGSDGPVSGRTSPAVAEPSARHDGGPCPGRPAGNRGSTGERAGLGERSDGDAGTVRWTPGL